MSELSEKRSLFNSTSDKYHPEEATILFHDS